MVTVFSVAEVASDSISSGATIVGVVVSTTVIFCDAIAEFPDTSVAVHVTIVSPSGKVDGALFVIIGFESMMSVVLAIPIETIFSIGDKASKTISSGIVIVGGVVSTTDIF